MSKQILFILDWYPTRTNNGCVFAKHLICAIADMGYDCVVVAPRPIYKGTFRQVNAAPYFREERTAQGSKVRIYMPHYLHLTSRKQTMGLSMNNHLHAVTKVLRKEKLNPDLVYGHFIYQCGLTAARVGEKLGIPAYCACGENSLRLEKGSKPYATGMAYHGWKEIIKKLSGIVCVSGNNERLLLECGFIDDNMHTGVFPNGVDENKFRKMDKAVCRKELGFPEEAFILVYTGAFTANKGADRLNEALKYCENVYSVFLGQGPMEPDCNRILFKGRIANDDVAKYLNAADVFVLPTRGEGCCNAIVEALSCGLPVISSDLPFNDDILNEGNSLRIDVEDVGQIREAIQKLYEDSQLRGELAKGALKSAKQLSIGMRAERIVKFMELSL
ncbi:MAG: glycosyltransferase [Oscillospiraceae bacterium]|nr:glycosyltransferase [Oscillospiraceae bacterium]